MRHLHSLNRNAVFAALAAATLASPAAADEVAVLTSFGQVGRLDTVAPPGPVTGLRAIVGLAPDERVTAIDTRPTTGVLYGIAGQRLYRIDLTTGRATPAGPRAEVELPRLSDFDPATGHLRIVQPAQLPKPVAFVDVTLSARLDPETMRLPVVNPAYGAPQAYFLELTYASDQPNAGAVPALAAMAYQPGPPAALYGIDGDRNELVRIGAFGVAPSSPEDHAVRTVAPLTGLPVGSIPSALEITREGTALALSRGNSASPTGLGLYSIDLATGAATLLRDLIDADSFVIDLATVPTAAVAAPDPLVVTKAAIRNGPGRSPRYQTIKVRGTIPFIGGGFEGKVLRVDVGGAVREFTIYQRGRRSWLAVAGHDSFRFVAIDERDGDLRLDYVLRMRPDRRHSMEGTPSAPGSFQAVVTFFLDRFTLQATADFTFGARKRAR